MTNPTAKDYDGLLSGRNDRVHGDENMARELGQYECSCGEDYTRDVARLGYAKWHREGIRTVAFVDDCSGKDCTRKLCHNCSADCQICGRRFCLDCTTEDIKAFGLCENCMGVYPEIADTPERGKLIAIERQLQDSRYYGVYSAKEDLARLLEIAKDTMVKASELKILEDRIGDTATDLFEQMLKGQWIDDHGHDVGKNIKMVELKQIVEGILKARGVK